LVLGVVGLVLLVVLLAVQLLALTRGGAGSGTVAEPTGITVTAEGKASGKPDLAMITLGVETRDPEAHKAAEQNNSQMAEVMAALREVGVAEEDIRTVDYSIQADIIWEDNRQRVVGYVVVNSVLVKMRDTDKVGDVLDAATEAGANNIYSIQFTFEDPSTLREQARAAAMTEARSKAEALAQLGGVGLGQPRQISESFVEPWTVYAEKAYARAPSADVTTTPVSAGQLEVTVQVQVTYDIG
jgi:hypothetical protein